MWLVGVEGYGKKKCPSVAAQWVALGMICWIGEFVGLFRYTKFPMFLLFENPIFLT